MTIWIDSDFRCYVSDDGTRRAIETDYFNGFCDAYIEGHRFVPSGETWTRSDGEVFEGEMVSALVGFTELEEAQREYELEQLTAELADTKAALELLGVRENG